MQYEHRIKQVLFITLLLRCLMSIFLSILSILEYHDFNCLDDNAQGDMKKKSIVHTQTKKTFPQFQPRMGSNKLKTSTLLYLEKSSELKMPSIMSSPQGGSISIIRNILACKFSNF